jgi:hypothetical protein
VARRQLGPGDQDIDVWRVANMISSRATNNEQGERVMARENP